MFPYTSMSQGPIRQTGKMLDIALSGDGFLTVQTDQGTLYTRAGNLAVNKAKQLVTRDGWPVLGKKGPIIVKDISNFHVSEDGQVFDGRRPGGPAQHCPVPDQTVCKRRKTGISSLKRQKSNRKRLRTAPFDRGTSKTPISIRSRKWPGWSKR